MNWKFFLSYSLTLLVTISLNAQDGSFANPIGDGEKQFIVQQLKDRFWGNDRSVYQLSTPEIYSQEDAIVLDQTHSREFYRNSRNYLRTTTLNHKVIRILSKTGVEQNSVFSYEHIDSEFAFDVTAIKVIKANGNERIINLDSIKITKEYDKVTYHRFVIPGLDVGDILDFYYYLEFRVLFPQQYSRVFDPVYLLPNDQYAILNYHLEFIMGPSAFLNVSSHKLPKFESANYKIDRKTFSRYHLELKALPPIDVELEAFYPFRELANLKYQVFIGPYSGNTDIVYNLGGSLKLNSGIQPSRLQDYMNYSLSPGNDYKRHYMDFVGYLKRAGIKPKKMEKEELARHYYYYIRGNKELDRLEERYVQTDAYQFVSRAHNVLSRLNIDHKILLAFDRSQTDFRQFSLTDEITPMIQITEADTFLLVNPLFNNVAGEINSRFEGTSAYQFTPSSYQLSRFEILPSAPQENLYHTEINIEPIEDGSAALEVVHTATGHIKETFQRQLLNKAELHLEGSYPAFPNIFSDRFAKKKGVAKGEEKLEVLSEERHEEILLGIQDRLQLNDLNVNDVSFDVLKQGISSEQPEFSWMEFWSASNLGRRGNDSYLISLNDIIGQTNFRPLISAERSMNMYFDYPLQLSSSLTFQSLDGYEWGEISQLNSVVENETASFKSSAHFAEDQLIINFNLTWNESFEPFENVALLIEVQDAYLKFKDQKVLYRKK